MRVISGKYKGMTIKDLIKKPDQQWLELRVSFFDDSNKVKGSVVLDLFAGSGSLGIEALSNGSKVVTL